MLALAASLLTTGVAPAPTYAAPLTCAQGGVCSVGDIGPGGGLVFYVSATPFSCGPNHANDCKYLEVAPKTWSGAATDPDLYWNINSNVVDGISRDASPNIAIDQVGLGLKNSNAIATFDTSTSNASVASRAYTGGSKNDWYLPTIAELGVLCRYAYGQSPIFSSTCDYGLTLNTGIPSTYQFESTSYQSSSQSSDPGNAQWHQNFVSAADGNSAQQSTWGYAATPYKTRPIRAFAPITNVADGDTNCGTTGTFTVLNNVVTTSSLDCSGTVTIPYGVTAIADAAFYLRQITSISLPNTVVTIGDSALRHTLMTTISIPGSVETIGFLAFGTTYLSSVTIPSASNLTTIGADAFQSSVFTSITFPASVTTVGTGVFGLNTNMTSLEFSGVIPNGYPWGAPAGLYLSGKVLCGTNGYFAIQSNAVIGRHNCRGSVVIPEGVTSIGLEAFDADPGYGGGVGRVGGGNLDDSTISTQITSLTIPSTVTSIGDFAFRHSRLTSLTIPDSVTSIGIYSFAFSNQITSLTLGSSLTSIGNAAFADVAITTLTIPDGVATIGGDAFAGTSPSLTLNYCGNANLAGTGLPNPSTNAGTCLPAPPQSLVATGLNQRASIAFTEGASFGATITNYQYSIDGGSFTALSPADTTTPVVVPGLTNGTTHSIRLRAVNARGVGAASASVSATAKTPISVAAIGGVTAPVVGATPVTAVTAANGYTGTVSWSGSPSTFSPTTVYTATITLTADSAYTLDGIAANFFTVAGAASVTHSANSETITAVFPATAIAPPAFTLSSASETVIAGYALTGYSINSTGGAIASYSISPTITNTPGLSFSTVTGLITGTPTTPASARAYAITAMNATAPVATETFTITVDTPPPPIVAIGTTNFTQRVATNLGVTLTDFNQTQSYQVTIKFVNTQTNADVVNGTLIATQGGTSLVTGYSSYSAPKLGFKGTYAQIATALSTVVWRPESVTAGISIRIGIASLPGSNEFYDANSRHYYKYVSTPATWEDARDASERLFLFGQRGYLSEVNTAAENAFIGTETTAINVWIGASDRITEGTWIWDGALISPKPVGNGTSSRGTNGNFASWASREPNDHPWYDSTIREDCTVTNWSGAIGMWNDWPCPVPQPYLVEFGGRPGETSTAAMATLTETLTAAAPIQYTITYNPNSGNSTPTQGSLTNGERFNLAGAITRTPSGGISYQFAGWSNSGSIYSANETFTVGTTNLTFTANWIQLYEVTYVANGGTFAGSDTAKDSECSANICTNGQAITLNSEPTRSGYTFDGWIDQTGSLVADTNPGSAGIQTTVTANRYIFTATWTEITYTITYISSGSTAPTQTPLATDQFFTVGNPVTKSGHRFDGWSDGSYIYQTNSAYKVETSNISFTALWTPQFTVTYSRGLGSGTPETDTALYITDDIVVLADDTGISRAGFTFGGWSDGSSTYQPGTAYVVRTSNITFTAVWSSPSVAAQPTSASTKPSIIWIVDFDRNGAESGNAPAPIRYFEDSKNAIKLPGNTGRQATAEARRPMARKGFIFLGWSTTKAGTTPLPELFTPTASTILYAIWGVAPTPVTTPTPKPTATQEPIKNPQPKPEMAKVGTVYMANGSYFLNDATKRTLTAVAKKINASGAKSILVYGHTNNRGGVNNTVLSQNRAKAVARYLRPLLNTKKISIGWFASRKPVATGNSKADLALNRRVEIYTK